MTRTARSNASRAGKGKPRLELHVQKEILHPRLFLTGAYQEILGKANLFATRTRAIRLAPHGYEVTDLVLATVTRC